MSRSSSCVCIACSGSLDSGPGALRVILPQFPGFRLNFQCTEIQIISIVIAQKGKFASRRDGMVGKSFDSEKDRAFVAENLSFSKSYLTRRSHQTAPRSVSRVLRLT